MTFLLRSAQLGGTELRTLDEADWLQRDGWRARIAVTKFPDIEHLRHRGAAAGIDISRLDFPLFMENWRWRHLNKLRAGIRARRLGAELASDLVHVPFPWTDLGLSTLWLAARVSQRCVISVHNVFPDWRMSDWHRRTLAGAFDKVVGIYGVSSAATQAYERIFGDLIPASASVRTIPNFVDCDRFVPNDTLCRPTRQRLGIPADAFVIAVLGRISEQKRPLLVVDVFARLRAQCPERDPWLLFIGGGELEDALWQSARNSGIEGRIRVTGFVDNPESFLTGADVHLLASIREGFGIATVEAMACGLPVIATDTEASHEVLAGMNGGMLIDTDDAAGIVRALHQIMTDDRQRRRRARQAREEALAHYSKAIWGERIRTFYDEAMVART